MKHVSWKKVVSLLTALVLCLSLAAIPAFAVRSEERRVGKECAA